MLPGDTVIAAVVAPVFQTYVLPPEAVSVADAPEQMLASLLLLPEVSFTAMDAVGCGFTVIVVEAVAVQLPVPVTVTMYAVVADGATVMAAVVAPLLQR